MKKKLMSLFLALTLLLSLCPTALAAEETNALHNRESREQAAETASSQADAASIQTSDIDEMYVPFIGIQVPEELEGVYSTSQLQAMLGEPDLAATAAETKAVNVLAAGEAMREAFKNRETSFSVVVETDEPYSATTKENLYSEVYDAAVAHTGAAKEGDYILRAGLWYYYGCSVVSSGSNYCSYRISLSQISYYSTAEQEAAVDAKVKAVLDSLNVYNASDYQKVKAVYDWLCANVEYDYDHLDDSTYTLQYTCYAALCQGTAVCQGISLAFYRMILELDVDTRIIRGYSNGGNHAWNITKLGKYYYNLDPTWDSGRKTYSYFLKCQSTFLDHERREQYDTAEFHSQFPMDTMDYTNRQAAGGSVAGSVCTYHHEYVTQAGSATCTVPALAAGISCSVCGTVIVEQEVLSPALGHKKVSTAAVAPTCTENGQTASTSCSRCGMTLSAATVIPALGHTEGDPAQTNYVAPTETKAGSYDVVVACTVCKEVLSTKSYIIPCTGSGSGLSMEEAVRINMNETKSVSWTVDTDEYDHYVLFEVPERGIVTFHATKPQDSYDNFGRMWFDIYNASGEIINGNDTYNAVDNSDNYYEFRCGLEAGTYYVNILAGFGVGSGTFTSDYTLSFTADPFCEVESNETEALATAITPGRKYTGHYGGDNNYYEQFDYYSFEATQGHIYMLTVENVDGLITSGATFMADGAADDELLSMLAADNSGSYTCRFKADESGTVYLYLADYYGLQFTYDLSIVDYTLLSDPKHEHSYIGEAVIEHYTDPTCGKAGSYDTVSYCTVCGWAQRISHSVPATGEHDFVAAAIVDPTCTEQGYTAYICQVCSETINGEFTQPVGHTHGEPVRENEAPAGCETPGSYESVVYCSSCGEELSREPMTTSAIGHTPGEPVWENEIPSDCENEGSCEQVIYCNTCGDELSRESRTITAIGHTPGETIRENEVSPDCVNPGSYQEVVYCDTCGEEVSRQTMPVPATGHTSGTPVRENEVSPDCVNPGSYQEVIYCDTCGDELSRQTMPVKATGHRWNGTVTVEPTETESGERLCTCEVCEATKTEVIPPLNHEHEYLPNVVAPTCTESGYTLYLCSCSDSYTINETAPNGHTPGQPVRENEKAADCETPGSYQEVVYCDTCGDELSRQFVNVPTTSHTHGQPVRENEVPSDCENSGSYQEVVYCGSCGVELSRQSITVPASGHTPGNPVRKNEVAADCENSGSYENIVYCGSCGVELSRQSITVPASGHTWDDGQTPESGGGILFTCTVCSATRTVTDPVVTRIAGSGRCETAILAADTLKAELGVEKFDYIILASGTNFADALAGSYLAAVKSAPILLHLDSRIQKNLNYILNNLADGGTVYLLGGTSAVSEDIEALLEGLNIHVKRLAGKDRFATNIEILKEAGIEPGQEILVATGFNFADSLSASASGMPILLVNSATNKLSDVQLQYLASLGVNNKITILGGTGAVSEELASWLSIFGNVDRLAGKNRFATSVMIAQTYFPNADTAFIAYGGNFPDGLSGGPVAYAMGAPLILTAPGSEALALGYIVEKDIYFGYVMGGENAVNGKTANTIFRVD